MTLSDALFYARACVYITGDETERRARDGAHSESLREHLLRSKRVFYSLHWICLVLREKTEEEEEEGKEEEEEREMRKRQQQELVASTSTDLSVGRTRTTKRVSSTSKSGKVTGELKRVLTREQIKSVKRRALWPEIFAEDDTEYTNKISEDVRRTISPDDLLKIEEKLRIENGGKKSKRKEKRKGRKAGGPPPPRRSSRGPPSPRTTRSSSAKRTERKKKKKKKNPPPPPPPRSRRCTRIPTFGETTDEF